MCKRQLGSFILIALILLSWGQAVGWAQEETPPSPPAGGAASVDGAEVPAVDAGAVDWNQALFVLLVLFLVMAGMIGFEWVHRRNTLL